MLAEAKSISDEVLPRFVGRRGGVHQTWNGKDLFTLAKDPAVEMGKAYAMGYGRMSDAGHGQATGLGLHLAITDGAPHFEQKPSLENVGLALTFGFASTIELCAGVDGLLDGGLSADIEAIRETFKATAPEVTVMPVEIGT